MEGNQNMAEQLDNECIDDQNTTSQQFDWSEDNVIPTYSLGEGRHDGSDFALGQHFESK